MAFGAGSPRSCAIPTAAEGRSWAWQELHPAMRMKLWLCFASRSSADPTAALTERLPEPWTAGPVDLFGRCAQEPGRFRVTAFDRQHGRRFVIAAGLVSDPPARSVLTAQARVYTVVTSGIPSRGLV